MRVKEFLKNSFLILSWSLYDLANQFFVLIVVSLYFPQWLTLEKKVPEIYYSIAFCASTFLVAVLSPLLGLASDISQRRKPFLIWLTLISIVFTMLLGFSTNVFLLLLFFMIANFGCQTAVVFYNAMMVNLPYIQKPGFISGFGRMFGYSGAILALYIMKPIVLNKGYQATFLPSGFLFLAFSLPCFFFIKDASAKERINLCLFFKKEKIIETLKTLKKSLSEVYKYPGLSDFLKGTFFGLCAVNVVIVFMAVYATKVFAFDKIQLTNFIAFSTLFAIIGSIFSGFVSDYIGYKRTLCAVFILWIACFSFGAIASITYQYWFIGALSAVALGSTWVVARAIIIKIVPQEKIGEVFGLFNLVGYLSAMAGVIFWGVILLLLSSLGALGYRIALLSLNLFMVLGFVFILRMPLFEKQKR